MPGPHNRYGDRWRVVLSLMILIGLCLLNYWMFRRFFSSNYLRWYASVGPFIGLATAAFAQAWGNLDRNVGLISANPLDYTGACLQVVGLPFIVMGGHIKSENQPNKVYLWNSLFALPLILAFVIAAFAWLLLVVPLQYFVFLICGAPSRIAKTSSLRVYARLMDKKIEYKEQHASKPAPETGWNASMRDSPVTLTNAFSAATLFLLDKFLS